MGIHYRLLDERSFSLSGSNFVSSGISNQLGYYIVVDPTVINNLGGTPSSTIAAATLQSSSLRQSAFDPAQPAADFAASNWISKGWNNPSDLTSWRNQVRDWLTNNLTNATLNPGSNDINFYLVDTTISGTRYLVPIVYLGADGPTIDEQLSWKLVGQGYWAAYANNMNTVAPTVTYTAQITSKSTESGLGAVLLPDGRVVTCPRNGSASVFDPVAGTVTTVTGFPAGSDKYHGGVLMFDGRVYMFPRNATAAKIYDPTSNTVTTPSGSYSNALGGVMLPDGRVFAVPGTGGSAKIYDPLTNTLSTTSQSLPSGGLYQYAGATLMPDDRVYIVPGLATQAKIYDPTTDTFSTPTGTYPGSYGYHSAILLPSGKIFVVPCSAAVAKIYDPVSDTLTNTTGTIPFSGSFSYLGASLLPNGQIFIVPCFGPSSTAAIYDPSTQSFTSTSALGSNFAGCVTMLDGKVFVAGLGAASKVYGNASTSFNNNVYLSGYYNKF